MALAHSGCSHLRYYGHMWEHTEHKRGWNPRSVSTAGSTMSVLWMAEGQAERDGLSRLEERAGQGGVCPGLPRAQSQFSMHREQGC